MKTGELYELRKKVGNLETVIGAEDYTLNDGSGKGVRAFRVRNGKNLEVIVAADRGLDIPFVTYKGKNMGFSSKTGLRNPSLYVEDETRGFLKQFFAGMVTSCGVTYAGLPCEDEGRKLGLHGPYNNLPAGYVSAQKETAGDEIVIRIRGEVREACVFEENMVVYRTITIYSERDEIEVCDTIENQGFMESPVMMMYHINFGYPMLDEGAKVYTDSTRMIPRDDWAENGPGVWNVMDAPEIGRGEQCYFHHDMVEGMAMIHNEKLGMAGIITFDKNAFSTLCEWKCMMAGDYALGLEPLVSHVQGRAYAKQNGILKTLKPGEKMDLRFKITYTDDPDEIKESISKSVKK